MNKKIEKIVSAVKVNMDGHLLDQPLPVPELDYLDPFLLIHHWNNSLTGGARQSEVGVGPHPHRGFSPITFIFKGAVHHRDSRGNDSIVEAGGTQWMDAGMGITHSERPTKELAESGGPFEIIQFWLNVPSEHKMNLPRYQAVPASETPLYQSPDGLATCAVVAGNQFGMDGPVDHSWPVLILRLTMKKGGKIELNIPEGFNSLLYNLDGNLMLNNESRIFMKELAVFSLDGETKLLLESNDNTRCILLAGKPIGEKVAKYGPFVMNNQTEIMQAMRDAQMGKMGILIEEFD